MSLRQCLFWSVFSTVANVIETDVIIQPNPVLVVEIGASATLQCFISEDETDYIYWFKQSVGQKPHLVAASHKYSSEAMFYNNFNSTRMKVLADVEINHLIISETKPMDSAMYYCGVLKNYDMIFGEGTFLIVRVQHLVSDPVYPGDSVTLQCTVDSETCAGEHSVYWFRHGSGESLPGLIYTHGNRSDECEKSPEAGSPTHSCVYSLPKRNLSCSDAGIYYCAVVTCGDILFGNGTELDIKGKLKNKDFMPYEHAALFICVIVIVVLVCTRNAKKCCESCTGRLYHYYNLQYNS
uniref:Ig-like domain-containing protein n=1 Tax=Scleropages formosus TaxID=113540 RepID=A0A8C9QPG8_SCLFO